MMNEMKEPGFYYKKGRAFVTKKSGLSAETNTVWIQDLEPESVDAWLNGEKIQNALFYLSPDNREFIKTGITPDEWNKAMFGA